MELYQESARQVRAQYTREFNHAAVRHVRSGHAIVVVAKVLGIPIDPAGIIHEAA